MKEQWYDNSVTRCKSKDFAIRIIKFVRLLQKEEGEKIISNQLFRSGTSIGANIRESYNAQSKADFINKLHIALKEADETAYWLELLYETDYLDEENFKNLKNACGTIRRMLIATCTTIKEKRSK